MPTRGGLPPVNRAAEGRSAATAARQHGVVTRGQLLEAGFSPSAVDRRAQSGRSRVLHRGVYLFAAFPLAHTREIAAVLAAGPGAVLSHRSAAALWCLAPIPGAEKPVDVTSAGNRGRVPGICLHRVRDLGDEERTTVEGIPITAPCRTLLDLAAHASRREMESLVARSEREGLVARDALVHTLACRKGHVGVRALRAVLDVPGGPALTRSEAETSFLALVRDAGLPPPEANASVGPYEVDFLWRRARIAVEVDGYRYHASRPRFEGDRRRDARLIAEGLTVMRLSWRQITHEPLATAVQLGQALARAGETAAGGLPGRPSAQRGLTPDRPCAHPITSQEPGPGSSGTPHSGHCVARKRSQSSSSGRPGKECPAPMS